MMGWILFFLTLLSIAIVKSSEEPETVFTGPIEEKFIIKTLERTVCKDENDQTFVWRTVESVKID